MAIELSASRLMSPYFGASTFTWTNIIGVIMIALSLGYLLGGKLANKKPELTALLKWVLVACGFLLFVPVVVDPLVNNFIRGLFKSAAGSTYIFLGSLLAVTLLFALPIMIFGMVSPFLITILSKTERVGDASGQVFSVSTLGSIIGTFLPVLVFIPFVGTSKTILFFASLLAIIAVIGYFNKKAYLLLLILIIPWGLSFRTVKADEGVLYESESSYQYMKVVNKNSSYLLQFNDGVGIQSLLRLNSVISGVYYDNFSLIPYLMKGEGKKKVAILGLAGGVIGKELHHFHPSLEIDGVEIDPKVIEVAKEYFELEETINVFVEDARIFIDQAKGKYDFVIVDTFSNELYIPFYMTTVEFFRSVHEHLNADGIVGMNVLGSSDDSKLLRGVINSLASNFEYVYSLRVMPDGFNYLLFASDSPIDMTGSDTKVNSELENTAKYSSNNIKRVFFDNKYAVLTDDKAPVEYMTDWTIINNVYK